MRVVKKNIQQGFYRNGRFHPIRDAADYSSKRAGERDLSAGALTKSHRLLRASKALKNRLKSNPDEERTDAVDQYFDVLDHLENQEVLTNEDIELVEILGEEAGFSEEQIAADIEEIAEGIEEPELVENGMFADAIKRKVNRYRAGRALKQKMKYEGRASRASARLSELQKNPAWLVNTTNALVGLASAAQLREHFERKPKSKQKSKITPRKNPHGDIFKEFTGRDATTTTPMEVSHIAPVKLDKLGDLVEIRLTDGRKLQFNPNSQKHKVWLTAANKRQMWITGTTVTKPNPELGDNEIAEIGVIDKIIYHEFKPIVGDKKPEYYVHELGEWSGEKPILAADSQGFPVIYGGNYSIESRGIVD